MLAKKSGKNVGKYMLNRHNIDSTNTHKECFMPEKSQVYIWCTGIARKPVQQCKIRIFSGFLSNFHFAKKQKKIIFCAQKNHVYWVDLRFSGPEQVSTIKCYGAGGKVVGNDSRGEWLDISPTKWKIYITLSRNNSELPPRSEKKFRVCRSLLCRLLL